MSGAHALVIAAAIIGAVLLFAFRFEMHTATGFVVYRLDRLTGTIVMCKTVVPVPAKQDCDPQ